MKQDAEKLTGMFRGLSELPRLLAFLVATSKQNPIPITTIAEEMRVSHSTANYALLSLKRAGLIEIDRRSKQNRHFPPSLCRLADCVTVTPTLIEIKTGGAIVTLQFMETK